MSSNLSLTNRVNLTIEGAPRNVITLTRALGGARVEIRVTAWANVTPDPALAGMSLAGNLQFRTGSAHQNPLMLCAVSTEDLFSPGTHPNTVTLVGLVTDQALRELEEVRADGELSLSLDNPQVTWIEGTPPALRQVTGSSLAFQVYAEPWAVEVEKVAASSYINIMVPVTDDEDLAVAVRRLRTARQHIGDGDFEAAAGELRKALEPVRAHYGVVAAFDAISKKPAKERSKEERWALRVQYLFNWLSAFEHDDSEAIKGCTMDRAEAMDALVDVAGKLHRVAADRRAGR